MIADYFTQCFICNRVHAGKCDSRVINHIEAMRKVAGEHNYAEDTVPEARRLNDGLAILFPEEPE